MYNTHQIVIRPSTPWHQLLGDFNYPNKMSPPIQLNQQLITEALQAAINSIRVQPTPPTVSSAPSPAVRSTPPRRTIPVTYLRRRNKLSKHFGSRLNQDHETDNELESDYSLTLPNKQTQPVFIRTPSPTRLNLRKTEAIRTNLAVLEAESLLIRLATIDKESELQKSFDLCTLSGSWIRCSKLSESNNV